MSRDDVQRAVAYAGALLLTIATGYRYAARKPPYFERPVTIVDHVTPREHDTRQALILIPQVGPLLPNGAEVTAFRPRDGKAWNDDAIYLTTVGLLPNQSVLPPWSTGGGVQYVIAVGGPFADPSYAPIAGFSNGWLYKHR